MVKTSPPDIPVGFIICKMKMYRTCYGNHIEEFDCIRQTENQVVYTDHNGHIVKEPKRSLAVNWHKTKEAAAGHLMAICENKIETLKRRLLDLEAER